MIRDLHDYKNLDNYYNQAEENYDEAIQTILARFPEVYPFGSLEPTLLPTVTFCCPKGHPLFNVKMDNKTQLWAARGKGSRGLNQRLDPKSLPPEQMVCSHSGCGLTVGTTLACPLHGPKHDKGIAERNRVVCLTNGCSYRGVHRGTRLLQLYAVAGLELKQKRIRLPS